MFALGVGSLATAGNSLASIPAPTSDVSGHTYPVARDGKNHAQELRYKAYDSYRYL
ncbi:hypothetical protein HAX54_017130, partial [Datura stramonium]|nr:hypothetical protein [Datura stramonium]